MNTELLQTVFSVLLPAFSGILVILIGWLFGAIIKWINEKIQDKKLQEFMLVSTTIVENVVFSLQQEVVDTLKERGTFDEDAQKEVKAKAVKLIEEQLTQKMKKYIVENYGNLYTWISEKIESTIYAIKR